MGTAGVHDGRDAHRITIHEVPLTEAGLAELVGLLDTIETSSRALDPEPYIARLESGPCGKLLQARWGEK